MPSNTSPIYSSAGDIQWAPAALSAANTAYDGTGTSATVFSASISGSFVQRLRFKASGSTTATVARIFINNGATSSVASNNFLFDEITLAASGTPTSASATTVYELPMNIALPPAYRIIATVGIAQTGAGWYVGAIGGSYLPI
jgi:hypothetical protein